MIDQRTFKQEKKIVALSMVGALITTIVVLSIVALPGHTTRLAIPFTSRLQSALRLDVFVIAWLAAAIANVARLRFFSEPDIAGSSTETGSDDVRQAGAILQNTFEQATLAIVTHLIVAANFNQSTVLVGTLVCLFAIGRLLFWVGYKHGAGGRAFGFALTFYPSILGLLASALMIPFA